MQTDLSVVVPAHNAAAHLPRLLDSIAALDGISWEVVAVDDASTDGTAELIAGTAENEPRVTPILLEKNGGAGVARNAGFAAATGRYTLFFDADDILHPAAAAETVELLDRSEADVAMTSYHSHRGTDESPSGMLGPDVEIWDEYLGGAHQRVGRLTDMPRLLEFTNYPWNKVLRTKVFRSRGLRFGETPVHNDILGHWGSLLFADRVLLVDSPLCTHIVPVGGRNLTNRKSPVRLALFDALDETYDTLLAHDPDRRRHYATAYWSFVMKTGNWAKDRTPASHLDEYMLRFHEHLVRIDVGDYSRLRRQNPVLARSIAQRALS
jgi:glycosyltransferase involved in cell wall biosynthesis